MLESKYYFIIHMKQMFGGNLWNRNTNCKIVVNIFLGS